jgi:hypothetical protein
MIATPGSQPLSVRQWINSYVTGRNQDLSALPQDAAQHALWAANVWYSIKKHWCLEAQRLIRDHRTMAAHESRPPDAQALSANIQ